MKMGFKENIRFAFIDEFANEIGKEKAYRMMSNFKCERVPALEYFLTRDYNGRIKPYKACYRCYRRMLHGRYLSHMKKLILSILKKRTLKKSFRVLNWNILH